MPAHRVADEICNCQLRPLRTDNHISDIITVLKGSVDYGSIVIFDRHPTSILFSGPDTEAAKQSTLDLPWIQKLFTPTRRDVQNRKARTQSQTNTNRVLHMKGHLFSWRVPSHSSTDRLLGWGLRRSGLWSTCIKHQCVSSQRHQHPNSNVTARNAVWSWSDDGIFSRPKILISKSDDSRYAGNIKDSIQGRLIRLLNLSQACSQSPWLISDPSSPSTMLRV